MDSLMYLMFIMAMALVITFGIEIIVASILFRYTKIPLSKAGNIGYGLGLVGTFILGWHQSDNVFNALRTLFG